MSNFQITGLNFPFSGAALFEALPRDALPWHFPAGHNIGQEGCGGRQAPAGKCYVSMKVSLKSELAPLLKTLIQGGNSIIVRGKQM